MRQFLADLHIHSRFSRATSSKLNAPVLAAWARIKGLSVIGTGDFTHPVWRQELGEALRFDEASGLYTLKDDTITAGILPELNPALSGEAGASPVRFLLQSEISSIYKRGGKVRKVHNLVYVPTLEAAEKLSRTLEQIGNLHSDGRPILGLDSRDLLEIVLETHPQAFLVPAHIWTPWFSVFGSKSGFDDISECYGDLTKHIFALETGLSSDPAMNRLWSALDPFRLISNSDAHSGENLGREANVFSGSMSYAGILQALQHPQQAGGTAFLGTLEFYPEEGKYHMDGHRKCDIMLTPEETRATGGLCPVCGGAITVGVLHRVMELADRATPVYAGEKGFASLVPLPEVLGEILGVGPKSRKVSDMYAKVLARFGPELSILREVPEADLARFFPPLGEAVARMRRGEVQLQGGYDGEYGVVRMFSEAEQREILRGAGVGKTPTGKTTEQGLSLLGEAAPSQKIRKKSTGAVPSPSPTFVATADSATDANEDDFTFSSLADEVSPTGAFAPDSVSPTPGAALKSFVSNPSVLDTATPPVTAQLTRVRVRPASTDSAAGNTAAVPQPFSVTAPAAHPGFDPTAPRPAATPLLLEGVEAGLNLDQERAVMAGPGPVLVLAGPGTGKTRTLVARAMHLLDEGIGARRILAVTFTRRAAMEMDSRLTEALGPGAPLPRTDTLHAIALELWHRIHDAPVLLSEESARRVFEEANAEETPVMIRDGWQAVNLARERMEQPAPEFEEMARRYFRQKAGWNLADYTDLLEFWLEQINNTLFTSPWGHVLVDEVQDLSPLQLALVRSLLSSSGEGFFGIGDPDQSIYGFRGAHGQCRDFFTAAWPGLEVITLTHNYRSRAGILSTAARVLTGHSACGALTPLRSGEATVHIFEAQGAESEASWIADRIRALIGMGGHTITDATHGKSSFAIKDATCSPGDIAVLVRTHALGRPLRKALARSGVPVAEPKADAFWEDPRTALIVSAAGRMFGISAPEGEGQSAMPDCPDKIFAKGPLGIAAYFASIPPFDSLFWQGSAFRALSKAFDTHGGWAELLTWINLQSELELVRAKGEKVQILSIHAAKGLEFPVVFLPCLEDGLMPFAGPEMLTGKSAKGYAPNVDEERRLFYVGITRAKDAIFLSHAAKRILFGRDIRLKPSRFLTALPEGVVTRSALVAHSVRQEKQLNLLGK